MRNSIPASFTINARKKQNLKDQKAMLESIREGKKRPEPKTRPDIFNETGAMMGKVAEKVLKEQESFDEDKLEDFWNKVMHHATPFAQSRARDGERVAELQLINDSKDAFSGDFLLPRPDAFKNKQEETEFYIKREYSEDIARIYALALQEIYNNDTDHVRQTIYSMRDAITE